jgi:hypothetical protein
MRHVPSPSMIIGRTLNTSSSVTWSLEHEEEEDHRGEESTVPSDLEEHGEHREHAMPSTKNEDHRGGGGRASHHTARSRAGRGAPGVGHAIDVNGGGHREEQGGHCGLVVGHAPWPHRQVEQMAVAPGGADVITTGWSRWPSRRVEQIRSPPGGVDGLRIGLSICGRQISGWSQEPGKWRPIWREPLEAEIEF